MGPSWRSGALLALVLSGCVAGPRPVDERTLGALSRRSYAVQFDEAYDATWLSLERLGFVVGERDRRRGTLEAQHPDGRTYAVEVEQRGSTMEVTAVPGPARQAWQLDGPLGEIARWDELGRQTRALLEAWRTWPEWSFEARRNTLTLGAFSVQVPREWARVDLEVSRRKVELQRHLPTGRGLNPTIVVEVDRRRPRHKHSPLVLEAGGRALSARTRLRLVEEVDSPLTARGYSGDVELMDPPGSHEVRWFLWDMRTPEWTVRLGAVCAREGEEACDTDWERVTGSIHSTGFEFPR